MQPYEQLEQEFGSWAGVKNVVACSSGTAALHLALEALQLPQGSAVLIPDFTMIACPRAATLAGFKPIFVDCGDDLLIDVESIEKALHLAYGLKIRAIMPVHIYGRRCNMERIARIAEAYGLYVIEDLAEAHGVPPHPASHAACWSFFSNKIIHGEEGGAVSFLEPWCEPLARELRCLGFTKKHDFMHTPRGHNYRLANLLATPIIDSLHEVKANTKARRIVEEWYNEFVPEEWHMPKRDAVWVYDLRIVGMRYPMQDYVVNYLNMQGIQARHGFKPCSKQPEYRDDTESSKASLLSQEVIYLPVYPHMSNLEVRRIVETLEEVVQRFR